MTDLDAMRFRQHAEIKKQYPDVILLFRRGDHYVAYAEDAGIVTSVLAPTQHLPELYECELDVKHWVYRIPARDIEAACGTLIAAGYRVALCDQVETAKALNVPQKTTRVVVPATEGSEND